MGSGTLIVLDTHALIWLDQDDPALGPVARQRIASALQEKVLAVSAISFWEVAMALLQKAVLITADRKLLEWPEQLERLDAWL